MEAWVGTLFGGLFGGGTLAAVLTFLATRKKQSDDVIATRLDDASELAKYVRAEVEKAVEKAVAPLREQIEKLERDRNEMHDAVRTRETQLWLWNLRGRAGVMPMLPAPILRSLGLGHLVPAEDSNETSLKE